MSGLGIELNQSFHADVPACDSTSQNIPPAKTSRRRANVRRRFGEDITSKASQAQLPCMPLRENKSALNTSSQPSPVYVMQHPLPAKPIVDWSTMDNVKHASATLRVETPSDTDSSPAFTHGQPPLIQCTPIKQTNSRSTLSLPASSTPSAGNMVHVLPAKPQLPSLFPPERDDRVGIEVFLENDVAVEGGCVHGCVRLCVPDSTDPSTAMLLAQPRVRLIGFETLPDDETRHIFYRHMSVIDGDRSADGPTEPYVLHGSPEFAKLEGAIQSMLPCYASLPDADGFYLGKGGEHVIPFTLQLPMDQGAKGGYKSANAEVGYIVIASVRVKAFGEQYGGVSHCFQRLNLYPYLNPTAILASSLVPIVSFSDSTEAQSRKIQLACSLHRETWIAGQRVYFDASVLNNGQNMLNILRIALVQTEKIYHSRGSASSFPLTVSSTSNIIMDETLAASNNGHWWTGAPCGVPVHFAHSIVIPSDVITVDKSRHVDVQFSLRIGVGADTSTLVEVDLPLRIVNFVSLDPPPPRKSWMGGPGLLGLSKQSQSDQHQMIERLRKMESLKSPSLACDINYLSPDTHLPRNPRTAHHKRSLVFINSAIRSATARHTSPLALQDESPTGLGIGLASSAPSSAASTPLNVKERLLFGPSLPALEIQRPSSTDADASLPLGDETMDDFELFFDGSVRKSDENSYSMQVACHENLDASNDDSLWMRGYETKAISPQPISTSVTAPSTPTRENSVSVSRGTASVPRMPTLKYSNVSERSSP